MEELKKLQAPISKSSMKWLKNLAYDRGQTIGQTLEHIFSVFSNANTDNGNTVSNADNTSTASNKSNKRNTSNTAPTKEEVDLYEDNIERDVFNSVPKDVRDAFDLTETNKWEDVIDGINIPKNIFAGSSRKLILDYVAKKKQELKSIEGING